MAPNDAELIARSARDPAAFGELFDRHYDAVHRYAVARLGRDDGEEVAAQTFLVALEHRDRYDATRADARPWLFGIATNLIRRARRDRGRGFRAVGRLRDRAATTWETDEVERVLLRDEMGPVAEAVGALRGRDREALLLYAWADLDYEGVAEALGIPVGTVRSRLHRAREVLRSQLAPASGGRA